MGYLDFNFRWAQAGSGSDLGSASGGLLSDREAASDDSNWIEKQLGDDFDTDSTTSSGWQIRADDASLRWAI